MPEKDPNELVYIQHKASAEVGGPVPRWTIEELWGPKGWREVKDQQAAAEATATTSNGGAQ